MGGFALWRVLAKSLAPLCASAAEGAQATEERQDKRNSLRPCPAVDFSLRSSLFAQAADLIRSLSGSTNDYGTKRIPTSSACTHVW
jgi:hypothetical protein